MILTNAVFTAYCACTICCGPKATGLAANGKPPVQGITVAASRSIPLGTKIAVQGRIFVVQDRLSKKYDSRFDFYFNNHNDAKKFGIWRGQTVTIQ